MTIKQQRKPLPAFSLQDARQIAVADADKISELLYDVSQKIYANVIH